MIIDCGKKYCDWVEIDVPKYIYGRRVSNDKYIVQFEIIDTQLNHRVLFSKAVPIKDIGNEKDIWEKLIGEIKTQ